MTEKMFNEKNSVLYQARYCAQEDFSIAVHIENSINILEHPFSMKSYENIKQIDTLITFHSRVVSWI